MKNKVGIPRGMLYYDYYLLWKEFFNNLDVEVVTSPKTNKDILNKGVHACVDEACLPVKVFHGHVEYLKDKVDYIFIPKFISIYMREYCCPKHLGLPDMVKHSVEGLPHIIDTEINLRKSNNNLKKSILYTGKYFIKSSKKIHRAYNEAYNQFSKYTKLMSRGVIPINAVGLYDDLSFNIKGSKEIYKRQILLLGHSYNIYDEYINMNIASKLKKRKIKVITAEMIEEISTRYYASKLSKRMFWTHGQKIVGAAFSLIERKIIDGIIYISAFGCGLDSVLMDLVERKAKEYKIPFTLLTIDEQTGEAGINTRIEAFLDMLEWRDNNEDYFSTHG
ncbi:acyl-CoA dehydratase activase-related protein [Clostridium sp. Cult2]|uniref:acyl-CoA dehydratase activase-related protein n=1 Tax=Clostridium sp. Cult2 TaxID=2079003 RepID=UPI001F2A86C9|nr:acyl-CoA dehydratase activase-related protein [Clostridium sp. Cult2]MCF6465702.1 hypothetical protein [Clostridium sp. Cult2]